MRRTPINSGNVRSVGYDAESRILEVEFMDKTLYRYFGIPATLHAELLSSSAQGLYFEAHIKKSSYQCVRVR